MRVSREKATENRERILTEAARLFRERGLSGVGVDALAEAAGLTHGSLYSQFGSKERLATEALSHALAGSSTRMDGSASLTQYVDQYLSPDHRDRPGGGCALAALGCEMPRQGRAVRQTFTQGLQRMMARLARLLPAGPERQREDDALAIVATLIGTLILARAVDEPELSDRILAAGRARLSRE
jgi:TetR/AcrR family transcriptional regulator, transcriptional repressor for nem operon